ncbi:MAG: hypothetical protein ACK5LS_01220 [Propioniciclava sp.]
MRVHQPDVGLFGVDDNGVPYDHRVGARGDDGNEWINYIHLDDTGESFHPNQGGYDAMA